LCAEDWRPRYLVAWRAAPRRWHRAGFRLFWRRKSRSRSQAEGDVSAEVKTLIRQMAEANVGWGAPRIHGELLKLGFLDNHVGSLASIDFFTVPTATFRVLYVFFVLALLHHPPRAHFAASCQGTTLHA
jgi:hypothetical protein